MATGNAPRTPTAAQLAQLAVLQATVVSTQATYNAIAAPLAAGGTLAAAQGAMLQAMAALKNYEAYIYGGAKPGVYDEGGPAVT